MGIIIWIIVGLIAGLVARALVPGRQSMGLIATTLLGIAGSLAGGFVGRLVSGQSGYGFHASGLIGSVLGAIALLLIWSAIGGRRRATA